MVKRRGNHIYAGAITFTPGRSHLAQGMYCAWPGKLNVHALAITFVPVATFCMVLQILAPGMNVIAGTCTFNLPGQAQGMPWARCDRRVGQKTSFFWNSIKALNFPIILYEIQSRRPDAMAITFTAGRSQLGPCNHIFPRAYSVPDLAS